MNSAEIPKARARVATKLVHCQPQEFVIAHFGQTGPRIRDARRTGLPRTRLSLQRSSRLSTIGPEGDVGEYRNCAGSDILDRVLHRAVGEAFPFRVLKDAAQFATHENYFCLSYIEHSEDSDVPTVWIRRPMSYRASKQYLSTTNGHRT